MTDLIVKWITVVIGIGIIMAIIIWLDKRDDNKIKENEQETYRAVSGGYKKALGYDDIALKRDIFGTYTAQINGEWHYRITLERFLEIIKEEERKALTNAEKGV